MTKFFGRAARVTCFDNADAVADPVVDPVTDPVADATPPATPPATPAAPKEKTFTQAQVDKYVVERNKAVKAEMQKLESNYTELLTQKNLTQEQRDKLESDLENVQKQMMSEKEQLELEKKKAAEKYETDLTTANEQREYYKNLFETSTIERSITDASSQKGGYGSELFIALLGPKSEMVDELDSAGEKTGRLVPRVNWETADENGAISTSYKSPTEVIELMKDMPERYGHMFKQNVAKGIGGGQASVGNPTHAGQIDHSKISTEEFFRLSETKEGRIQLGLEK